MFTLVYGNDLHHFAQLGNEMFQARRSQFKEQLGWDLKVDALGREMDEYDRMNPLYVIMSDEQGHHVGSSRVMPTTGRTMIADHFSDMTDGVAIESPLIWECTRFFMSERSIRNRKHVAAMMWAGCQLGLRAGVQFYVGVAETPMVRLYNIGGWPAEVIGTRSGPEGDISACLWEVNEERCEVMRRRAGIDPDSVKLEIFRPDRDASTIDGRLHRHVTPVAPQYPGTGLPVAA